MSGKLPESELFVREISCNGAELAQSGPRFESNEQFSMAMTLKPEFEKLGKVPWSCVLARSSTWSCGNASADDQLTGMVPVRSVFLIASPNREGNDPFCAQTSGSAPAMLLL